jgi:WD40 repeat protein
MAMGSGRRLLLATICVAAPAVACGSRGTRSIPPADLSEVLLDPGDGKQLMAIGVQTCSNRELPVIGREPVAFTRDHKVAATLRKTPSVSPAAVPSRLSVGPSTNDERDTVWTVGNHASGGMAFDPSGTRIALGLQRTFDRGGTFAAGAVDDGLWIVHASGDNKRQLVEGNPETFAWSPNGEQIASTTTESSPGGLLSTKVWIVDVGSRRQRILTTLDQSTTTIAVMDWSPDGQNILLLTGTTGPTPGRTATKLEQVGIDGRRTPLADLGADDAYSRAVYSADGKAVIVQGTRFPTDPPTPPGGPWTTIPALGATDRRTSELISVRTDGTDLHPLCPINPNDKLLDWH